MEVMVKTYPCQNVPNQNVPTFGLNVPTFLVKTYPVHKNVPTFLVKTYPIFFPPYLYIFVLFGVIKVAHLFVQSVPNIYFIYFIKRRAGLVVNTLAYHTGDPGSIPGRGGSSEKCESI